MFFANRFDRLVAWHDRLVDDPDKRLLPPRSPWPNFDGDLMRWLEPQGLRPSAWKPCSEYGDVVFEMLGPTWIDDARPAQSVRNVITYLNLLDACGMGGNFLPPIALVRSMPEWGIPGQCLDFVHPNFFRALWGACTIAAYRLPNSQHAVEKFVRKAMMAPVRWYFSTGHHLDETFNDYLKTRGWLELHGQPQDWKAKQEEIWMWRERDSPAPAEWPSIAEETEIGGYRIVPLRSRRALMLESAALGHCIKTYLERCRSGKIQAFSVRKPPDLWWPRATMTLKKTEDGSWSYDHLEGWFDFMIGDDILEAVQTFAQAITGREVILVENDRGRVFNLADARWAGPPTRDCFR